MPTREQVWEAADKVLARGEAPVSTKTVLAELRRPTLPGEAPPIGGTDRTVGLPLRDWKVARAYEPRLAAEVLPRRFRDELDRFAKAVWSSATDEIAARLTDERTRLFEEARANDELRSEAMIEAEAARADVERFRAENADLRNQVDDLRKRLDHIHAEQFWDRVMQEAYEILPGEGAMSASEIYSRLPAATQQAARLVRERLTAGMLRKKIEVRIDWNRYFEKQGEDAYARLPGWNGALGRKVD